ncbi:11887_t:CDS:1 [Funneliformis geosporum]|nr:11887_t:CDS:1 [Funneliformis geosporum]
MSANISCLETLALNILKNSFTEKISEGVNVSELDPCLLCNQELFLYEIKKPFTILTCGYIYHRNCIKSSIETSPSCLRPDCKKKVESAVINSSGKQKDDNDSMDISPLLSNDSPLLLFPDHSLKKYINESTDKASNKKAKMLINRNDSPKLKKLIEELSSETSQDPEIIEVETSDFSDLYSVIVKMEGQVEIKNRVVIKSYYNFRKAVDN